MARRSKPDIGSLMKTMGPPVSSLPWSPDFVAQTLEILPVGLGSDGLFWMKPIHADSLRVGLSPSAKPHEAVLDVLKWYPLQPVVVHSTSWRHEDGRVILTYVAVIEDPSALPDDSLVRLRVGRAKLARGGATTAPGLIGVDAVLEHALRHLSWLVKDDPAVMQGLADWTLALAQFQPEPFRALEGRPESLDGRSGRPGVSDSGQAPSRAARASVMRKRAAQKLSPKVGRMGTGDPSRPLPAEPRA